MWGLLRLFELRFSAAFLLRFGGGGWGSADAATAASAGAKFALGTVFAGSAWVFAFALRGFEGEAQQDEGDERAHRFTWRRSKSK